MHPQLQHRDTGRHVSMAQRSCNTCLYQHKQPTAGPACAVARRRCTPTHACCYVWVLPIQALAPQPHLLCHIVLLVHVLQVTQTAAAGIQSQQALQQEPRCFPSCPATQVDAKASAASSRQVGPSCHGCFGSLTVHLHTAGTTPTLAPHQGILAAYASASPLYATTAAAVAPVSPGRP